MVKHYDLYPTDDYLKSFDNLDKLKQGAIIKKLKKFKENPYHFSHSLKGPLDGKRAVEILSDLRVVVSVCEECRKENKQDYNGCINCEKAPQNAIVIWDVGKHPIYGHLSKSKKRFVFP